MKTKQPFLCVSVAHYGLHSPLWEVLTYWSDQPRVDLKGRTFGSLESAMRWADREEKRAQAYRVRVKRFLCGQEYDPATGDVVR